VGLNDHYCHLILNIISLNVGRRRGRRIRRSRSTYLISSITRSRAVLDNCPQIVALAEQVKELKDTINILISQIQMLRSELKK
jgi:ubiquinone biosynthesis protein UbiJ